MLAGGLDPLYRKALSKPHRHRARVEVWDGTGTSKLATLDPSDDRYGQRMCYLPGSTVQATLNNRVSRTMNLEVPAYLYPEDPFGLLAPFGNELRAWRGVSFGDGSFYEWQVFRGRIRTINQYSTGSCFATASDRGADVVDSAFIRPENSDTSNTVYQEFVRLTQDAVQNPTYGASDQIAVPVQALTWEFDRAAALDEMATSGSALWYALANGDFVLRKYPWVQTTDPLLTISDTGENPIIQYWDRGRSRDAISNIVVVSGERLNGDAPVHAVATDVGTGSPTNPITFGRKVRLDVLQTPASVAQAGSAARDLLKTLIAPVETWTVGIAPDGSLELGDVINLSVESGSSVQVITAMTVPLHLGEFNMSVSTRSLVPSGLGV